MTRLLPPPLVFEGARWSSEELTDLAARWRRVLADGSRAAGRCLAMVMENRPRSVALFFALSAMPEPLVLLPPDLRPWRSSPPLPPATRLVLLQEQESLAAEARSLGLDPIVLSDADATPAASGDPPFMSMPGVVLFTSGSTGLPRPVYRATPALVSVARALVSALGLAPGAGVVSSLPLARAFGLNHGLMAATVLRAPLALLDHFEHTALLRLFATQAHQYWAGAPVMADVLGRCALDARPSAPPFCLMGGRVTEDVAARFRDRFAVPLRVGYGTTETGTIAVDAAPAREVRSDTVGRPIAGVSVRIGDDPRSPVAAGTPGRIWLSAPAYMMDGYGFPPALAPADSVGGWWGTPDVGVLGDDGTLRIAARLDDTWRTSAGHLVSPAPVAAALERYPGVVDTAVVPLAASSGPVLGALVESAVPIALADLRRHLARSLPAWLLPRVVECTAALPRLSSGKVDRAACIAVLARGLGRGVGA